MRLRIYHDTGTGTFDPDAMLFDGDSSHTPGVGDEIAFAGGSYTVQRRCFVFHTEDDLFGVALYVKSTETFFEGIGRRHVGR